jgi:hypothetical protein
MTTTILVLANLLVTIVSSVWLSNLAKHQRQVVKDQSQKLADLEKYTGLFNTME